MLPNTENRKPKTDLVPDRQSSMITFAALWPGAPVTPPPDGRQGRMEGSDIRVFGAGRAPALASKPIARGEKDADIAPRSGGAPSALRDSPLTEVLDDDLRCVVPRRAGDAAAGVGAGAAEIEPFDRHPIIAVPRLRAHGEHLIER